MLHKCYPSFGLVNSISTPHVCGFSITLLGSSAAESNPCGMKWWKHLHGGASALSAKQQQSSLDYAGISPTLYYFLRR